MTSPKQTAAERAEQVLHHNRTAHARHLIDSVPRVRQAGMTIAADRYLRGAAEALDGIETPEAQELRDRIQELSSAENVGAEG